jgi:dTDP-4-dehydrorhamnose reductase
MGYLAKGLPMKIAVLGSTGMLGNAVGSYFLQHYGEDNVFLSYRDAQVAYGKRRFAFDPLVQPLEAIPKCDVLINCIGVTKPFMKSSAVNAIKINSLLPWQLADYCQANGMRMFHITTDCVFSGKDGNYTEKSPHDALDDYGKSKSLGEPDNCMVIRTSIIGEEIHKNAFLIAWVKNQAGKEANGFTNHLWNGVTTKQYAKILDAILGNDWYQNGLFHVFSSTSVNKYELVKLISDRFQLGVRVKPIEADPPCDRTLSTVKDLCGKLNVPSVERQIEEL